MANVPLAENALAEVGYKTALETYIRGPVEACSRQDKKLVERPTTLLRRRFTMPMPITTIIISPDHIWLLICQGFASHVNNHAEALRKQFVKHAGKKARFSRTKRRLIQEAGVLILNLNC